MATTQTDSSNTPMPHIDTTCPKCSGTMLEGYTIDKGYGAFFQEIWLAGRPRSGWFGVSVPSTAVPIPVSRYRCENCGYLEFYARKEFKMK